MIYYQLPTGKVIQMTIDEYLNLSDKDIQYHISVNGGDYISNPWTGSSINNKDLPDKLEDDEDLEEIDDLETYFEEFFPEDFDSMDEGGIYKFDE